jgi:hypothetical protein
MNVSITRRPTTLEVSTMKTVLLILLAIVGLVPPVAAQDDRVTVELANPPAFVDFKTSCAPRPADLTALATQLERYLKTTAGRLLPEGQRMEITVTNIDMAGDIEAWRSPFLCDLRTMKDIYPPRIDLTFRILDAEGKEVRGGARQLVDVNYLDRAAPSGIDQLRYEKYLLSDWLQRELGARAGS